MTKFNAGKASVLVLTSALTTLVMLTVGFAFLPAHSAAAPAINTPYFNLAVCYEGPLSGDIPTGARFGYLAHDLPPDPVVSTNKVTPNTYTIPFSGAPIGLDSVRIWSETLYPAINNIVWTVNISGVGNKTATIGDGTAGTGWKTTMHCPIPEPTPNPDVCPNLDGVQYSIPEGLHMDGGGINCVSFTPAGPPPEGPYTPPQGQVLGASTLAGTGSFAENLYLAIMAIGGIVTFAGIKNFKKAI